jgi:hypothetical protein
MADIHSPTRQGFRNRRPHIGDQEYGFAMVRLTTDELVVVPNAFLFKNPVRVLNDQQQANRHCRCVA